MTEEIVADFLRAVGSYNTSCDLCRFCVFSNRPTKYFGHKSPESFKILHPEFISYVTHRWRTRGCFLFKCRCLFCALHIVILSLYLWFHRFLNSYRLTHPRLGSVYRPSTGALMLLTALHSCDQVTHIQTCAQRLMDTAVFYLAAVLQQCFSIYVNIRFY